MPKDAHPHHGMIGPNAILQMLPVLDKAHGRIARDALLGAAGITQLPDGSQMIPETEAAALHAHLRKAEPGMAPLLADQAGRGTADYILAHRIPPAARTLLRHLPAPLAAWGLSKAISAHAWTFAGSGSFVRKSSWNFEIRNNPLIRGEHSPTPICHWHAAVFGQLYARLVHPSCRCIETECGAQTDGGSCRFTLFRVT